MSVEQFLRAFSAETLKMKRTLALALTFLAPLVVAFLELMAVWQQGDAAGVSGIDPWVWMPQQALVIWGVLMLPLFVTLETGLLTGMEHSNKTWKSIYALPVPRTAILAAKQAMALCLVGLSMLVMTLLVLLDGIVLRFLRPDLGFAGWPPFGPLLISTGLTFLAAWLIIAIHIWISARWSSFVLAMASGVTATIAGAMLFSSDLPRFYPWTLPGMTANEFIRGGVNSTIIQVVLLGVAGGLVVFLLSNWDLARKDVL